MLSAIRSVRQETLLVAQDAPPDLLTDLTPAQGEAVRHFEGPLLILAGAGSGKTRVITRRVAYLIQEGVRPSNILAITFTNKAAGEMRQRVEVLLPGPERYAERAQDFFSQTVARVYPVYEKKLRDANALDFDDLLLWPALALKHDAELREELDSRFRFVLIDEYQDTNMAQYAIARGLAVDAPNLCVVGDPDQSIYRWRNADIRNILDFERDFPTARVITLERNYRSTKSILQAAS